MFRNLPAAPRTFGAAKKSVAIGRRLVILLAAALVFAAAFIVNSPASDAATEGGGTLLPATAQPHGWSLTRMTRAAANFNASGNNCEYYPDTPFQILYPNGTTWNDADGGKYATGSNAFTVRPGTWFYVPVWNADDSPPIVGTWPTTRRQAMRYFFDPAQVGAKDLHITVDGRTTPLGPSYVAGPVTTPPLPDGNGTHLVTVGAFLSPLSAGKHIVSIGGGVFGTAVATAYHPAKFLVEDLTYSVTVGK